MSEDAEMHRDNKSRLTRWFCFCFVVTFFLSSPHDARTRILDDLQSIWLYALDCSRVEFKDMAMFSDTGEYDGKPGVLATPCFLIRHPEGVLLWDTGMGETSLPS